MKRFSNWEVNNLKVENQLVNWYEVKKMRRSTNEKGWQILKVDKLFRSTNVMVDTYYGRQMVWLTNIMVGKWYGWQI
jgi:hypothetical protein